ncbi:Alpha/Beta hydrolase protein [Powellomyces hirtus]|nr:Alpha/Beta hydrolase protein [Powellomyces hirtus]
MCSTELPSKEPFESVPVTFPSAETAPAPPADPGSPITLAGTLLFPPSQNDGKRFPAILILAGSGNLDRDGNVHHWLTGVKLNIYNHLAEALVKKSGCAVLRFDKRGCGESVVPGDPDAFFRAGMWNFIDDAVGAYCFLAAHPRIDIARIYVLGHSEGALMLYQICSRIASMSLPQPFGIVSISGFAQSLPEATAYQRKLLAQEVTDAKGLKGIILRRAVPPDTIDSKAEAAIDDYFKEPLCDFNTKLVGLVKTPCKWYRDHWIYAGERPSVETGKCVNEMIKDAQKVTCHVFALCGAKDVQVIPSHHSETRLAEWTPNAISSHAEIIEDMNHILRKQVEPASFLDLKAVYAKGALQLIDERLVDSLTNWVQRTQGQTTGSLRQF